MKPEEIKELRTRLGLSQPEAAKLVRVEWHTWMRWERGIHKPHPVYLEKLHQLRDTLTQETPPCFER